MAHYALRIWPLRESEEQWKAVFENQRPANARKLLELLSSYSA
jgi:hypothetical protein